MKSEKMVIWPEIIFDSIYLFVTATMGVYLIATAGSNSLRMMFGYMGLLLMFGDSFHLIPRIISSFTSKTAALTRALGIGKCITSITMTIFYLMLAYILFAYYQYSPSTMLITIIWILVILRILFCLFPLNQWNNDNKKMIFPILRNIPFVLLGMIVMILFIQQRNEVMNIFNNMWIAIFLSFAFYLPVALFVGKKPRLGMLMLPKTCMYVWMICMGLRL